MSTPTKNYNWIIYAASIIVPVAVALLYLIPKASSDVKAFDFLPGLNAFINGTTTLVLILAFIAIKSKNILLHKRLMMTALGLSVLFLISYVTYHFTHSSVKFGDADFNGIVDEVEKAAVGWRRNIYFFILLTHIVLAIFIVPLVLVTFVRALSKKFDKHKKIARITLPLWLYVTITGVIVYLMISPYYH